MANIKITIAGTTNSGKSTLAAALHDFLVSRGVRVECVVDEPDVDVREIPSEFIDKCMESVAASTTVVIETVQVQRR